MKSKSIEINPMFAKEEGDKDDRQSGLTSNNNINKNNGQEFMIFDSIQIQFNPGTFFLQLFLHVFAFFFCLSPNPVAQGFGGFSMDMVYNFGLTLIVYVMVVAYFMVPKETLVVLSGAVWIPLIYFLQHKLVVALKYASLTPTEYNRFMTCRDPSLTALYRNQMQLISAWLNRDESILEFELGAAAIRVGTKLSDIFCVIANPLKSLSNRSQLSYWHAFLRGREFVDESIESTDGLEERYDGHYQVSVFDILTALVRRCDSRNFGESVCFYVIYFFCFITIVIPFLVLGRDASVPHMVNHWVVIFYVTSSVVNVTFGPVVYNLLYVAIFDVLRQLQMVDELTAFIRISDLTLSTEESAFDTETQDDDTPLDQQQDRTPSSTAPTSSVDTTGTSSSSTTFASQQSQENVRRLSTAQWRSDLTSEAIFKLNRPSERAISTLHPTSTVHIAHSPWHKQAGGLLPLGRHSHASETQRVSNMSTASYCGHLDPFTTNRYTELGERLAKDGQRADIPRLSFDSAENILAWTYARLALQNFGDRFRYRIDIYVGGTIGIMVLLIAASLAVVFSYKNRFDALMSCFVLQSLVTVNLIYLFLLVITYLSAQMNEKYRSQKQLLTRHSMRQRMKWLQATKLAELRVAHLSQRIKEPTNGTYETDRRWQKYQAEATRAKYALEQLESCIDVLDSENEWKPFTIFGMEATSSLSMTVLSSYISFVGVVLMLFTNNTSLGSALITV